MLILYLAVLVTGIYWVIKNLGPEMSKSPLAKIPAHSKLLVTFKANEAESKIEKLQSLLVESNNNMVLLQKELKILKNKERNFDKIKSLLDEEIHSLREQNHIFRSELGLPAVQSKENSIT